jgi:hypothetical protein
MDSNEHKDYDWLTPGMVCRVFHTDYDTKAVYETPSIFAGVDEHTDCMSFLCLDSDEPVVSIHRLNKETKEFELVNPDEDGLYDDIKPGDVLHIQYTNDEPIQTVPKAGAFEYGFAVDDEFVEGLSPVLLSSGKTPRYDTEYSHDKNGLYVAVDKNDFQKLMDFDLFLLDENAKFDTEEDDDETDDIVDIDEDDDDVYMEGVDDENGEEEDEYDVDDLLLFSYSDFAKLGSMLDTKSIEEPISKIVAKHGKYNYRDSVENAELDDK